MAPRLEIGQRFKKKRMPKVILPKGIFLALSIPTTLFGWKADQHLANGLQSSELPFDILKMVWISAIFLELYLSA